jgi:hypothetical protein
VRLFGLSGETGLVDKGWAYWKGGRRTQLLGCHMRALWVAKKRLRSIKKKES